MAIQITFYHFLYNLQNKTMTIILDVGAREIKAGLNTEALPSLRFSSYCMKNESGYTHVKFLNKNQCAYEYESCLSNRTTNKPCFEAVMDEVMGLFSSKSLIWVKSNDHTRVMGNEAYEMFYEKYNIQNIYSASSPVLVALSYNQLNALVIESGYTSSRCSVVFSGYGLEHPTTETSVAGDFITKRITERISSDFSALVPPLQQNSSSSFRNLEIQQFFEQLKLAPKSFNGFDIDSYSKNLLFPATPEEDNIGLDNLTLKTMMKCDYDVINKVSEKLLFAGGTTLLPGVSEKILDSFTKYFPTLQPKVIKSDTISSQKYAAWRGGAIIANTEAIAKVFVTKKDYEENGIGIVDRRCG
ncbi:actin-100, putative [Entamoeba invadens IP1]|uniref:Actin-100, putative n=1 Tax=Entamoeba invadens IP1 TaxID=370355 RepID=A0A0A1UBH1_ENTIV|nr:actin-100, putative [Entamoeba invadens IP1]ELP91012.1 actin-100, putative [Entamoeba invadens IP1]|eukprot:XP_004257783.1 actin-100, putative [Entamoeba invadens IP1]